MRRSDQIVVSVVTTEYDECRDLLLVRNALSGALCFRDARDSNASMPEV